MPKNNIPKRKGRKKLSLYNRTVKYYWKAVNDSRAKGNKISYLDARVKLRKVYKEIKSIQNQSDKPVFIGNRKRDYNLIKRLFKVTKLEPTDYNTEPNSQLELLQLPNANVTGEANWYNFDQSIRILNETSNNQYDNLVFDFDLDDSGSIDGQRFLLNQIDGRPIKITDITSLLYHTEFWWYCREHNNGEYNNSPVPMFYIKERRGNDYVKYGMTRFIEGDGSTIPTPVKPIEEKKTIEEKPLVESEEVRLQELKTREAEELNKARQAEKEIEVEKTKQKHSDERKEIRDMFKQGLISKDEMMQLLEMI